MKGHGRKCYVVEWKMMALWVFLKIEFSEMFLSLVQDCVDFKLIDRGCFKLQIRLKLMVQA
jgi:hypothetical protein